MERPLLTTDEPSDASDVPGLREALRRNLEGELHRVQLEPGRVINGKWELIRRRGAGGFGQVWEAWHVELEQPFAIKFLEDKHRKSADVRARFLAEARLMAELSSEHLVRVTDYGEQPDDVPYFVMELVPGPTLRERLGKPLPVARALEIAEELLEGLCVMHQRGVTHGDVKPENIILSGAEEKVRVVDFGLAQVAAQPSGASGGTPPYMAPEILLHGAPATPRSDVYAVAVVLYEMLTGRLPRGYLSMDIERIRRSWKKPGVAPMRMHRPDVPEAVDRLVMEALAKDPAARPKTADEMLEALRAVTARVAEGLADTLGPEQVAARAETEPRSEREAVGQPRGLVSRAWVGGAVGLAVLAGLAVLVWQLWPRIGDGPVERADDFSAAKHGTLVVATADAEGAAASAYEWICAALRERLPSEKPLHCMRLVDGAASTETVVDRANDAGVKTVVLVGDRIVVRSTSHDDASPLVAQLEGLPLPKEAVLRDVAVVLYALVDPQGARQERIPVLERKDVGARWAVLAELLRAQRGEEDPDALARREELKTSLHEDLAAAHDEREKIEARFYRDLAALLWAQESTCDNNASTLNDLTIPGAHAVAIRVAALLGLAACLVEGEVISVERAANAALLVEQAIEASGGDPCVRVAAVGTISRIDRARGNDELWKQHEGQLPEEKVSCDPAIRSQAFSVRADTLAEAERWCDAAEHYERAYGAMSTRSDPLLAWAEMDWLCKPDRTPPRSELLQRLRAGVEAQRHGLVERVSIAYMLWWLTKNSDDAQRVVTLYHEVKEGAPALIEGVGSELEREICGRLNDPSCSLTILARMKRAGDEERLLAAFGLR